MITPSLVVFLLFIVVANYLFTRWFIRYAKVRRITDYPTARSSHEVPTPKGGGVGFVWVTLLTYSVYLVVHSLYDMTGLPVLVLILATVSCLGWFDDKHDLSKRIRFGVQSLAAIAAIVFLGGLESIYVPLLGMAEPGLLGSIIAFFWITGTANIYNFMDGVDGIASVQAVGASVGWMIFAWIWDVPELFTMNLFLLVALSVFLTFNWAPAKIFMGDVGSLFLGFAFAIMPFLAAYESDSVAAGETIWIAGLLLWPFLFDGAYTIFRRLSREENIFKAHRSHLYQRLNIVGWSHSRISLLYLAFSVIGIGCALLFHYSTGWSQIVLFALLVTASICFIVFVKRTEIREPVK